MLFLPRTCGSPRIGPPWIPLELWRMLGLFSVTLHLPLFSSPVLIGGAAAVVGVHPAPAAPPAGRRAPLPFIPSHRPLG